MAPDSEHDEDFWQGVDTVNVAEPDGGEPDPYEETDTIPGLTPLGVTFRELHAFIYGLVPAFMAFLLFGELHHLAWAGILIAGAVAAYGFKKIPSQIVNRAIVRDPGWFFGGVLFGVPLGGVAHVVFNAVGIF